MESERFDAVTRRLSTASTRRGVLGVLTGVVSLGLGEVAAKRRHRKGRQQDSPRAKCKYAGRPCAFNTNCCSKTCCNKVCCEPGQVCNFGTCCTPKTAAQACGSQSCGSADNGCGGTVTCTGCQGVCQPNNTCCTPKTCADYPGQCGAALDNGCGGTLDCSRACATGLTCLDNGSCAKPCAGLEDCPDGCSCILDGASQENSYCFPSSATCTGEAECETDADCPVGRACMSCAPSTKCTPLCGAS